MISARVAERVRAAFRELEGALIAIVEADEWVDQTSSPLGRRAHNDACRTGKLPARKLRGKWFARRSDVDAYIEQGGRTAKLLAEHSSEDATVSDILRFRAPARHRRAG